MNEDKFRSSLEDMFTPGDMSDTDNRRKRFEAGKANQKAARRLSIGAAALFVVTAFTISAFAGLLPENIFAHTGTDEVELADYLFTYEIKDDNTVKITGSDVGFGKSVVIPSEIRGLPVSSIGNLIFVNNEALMEVTIPDTITEIEGDAFLHTGWLDGLTDEFAVVGDGVLIDYNGSGGDVIVPDGVKYISSAFYQCADVTSVTLPDSVTVIEEHAFYDCTSLKAVNIPESVTEIGNSAFYGCASLESISVPKSVKSVGCAAFENTPWFERLTDEFVIVGDGVLIDYNGSDSVVTVPDGVKYLSSAFYRNDSMTGVNIPDGVTGISAYAFEGCTALTDVTLPGSVTEINDGAFYGCRQLERIALPDDIVSIGNGAFSDCYKLKSVSLPQKLEKIGRNAFYGCMKLESVDLPTGVKTIGDSAFRNCKSLVSVDIPNGVTRIGACAFAECTLLAEVSIPDSAVYMGSAAFLDTAWFGGLTDEFVIVGDGVLIDYNGNAADVVVPSGVKAVGGAFYENSTVVSVSLPKSVVTVLPSAFYGCQALENITFSKGLKVVSAGAFMFCISLKTVTLPEGVAAVGTAAFMHCQELESVSLPGSVKVMGKIVFSECSSLKTVNFRGSKSVWDALGAELPDGTEVITASD